MAELVDALDLGSSIARCEGSSPFVRISNSFKAYNAWKTEILGLYSPTKIDMAVASKM